MCAGQYSENIHILYNGSLIRELTGGVGLLPQESGPGTYETDRDISVLHQLRNVLRPAGGRARMVRPHPLHSLLTPASGSPPCTPALESVLWESRDSTRDQSLIRRLLPSI